MSALLQCSVEVRQVAVERRKVPAQVLSAIYYGEICWILSEVTWVLLVPHVCLPAGALACAFIGSAAIITARVGSRDDVAQSFSLFFQLCWLLINFVWMLDEVLWDAPERPTPWNLTPIAAEKPDLHTTVELLCAGAFCSLFVGFLCVILFFCLCGNRWGLPSAKGMLIETGYMSTWALMDGLWAFGTTSWLALASALVTVVLIPFSSYAETDLGLRGLDRTDVVWVLWTVSNFLWIWTEQVADDSLSCRFLAAGVGVASLLVLLVSFNQMQVRNEAPTVGICIDS